MEKSEPALVPEWLKNSGSSTGGSSTSHSDDHAASGIVRNKSFVNSNGNDFGRPSSTDRTTSSYFRRSSSSNGSGNLRSYSSFSRNHRDRGWEKDTRDKDKLVLGDRRHHRDFSDPLENTLSSKFERDGIRRSQSMISGKRVETWNKKVATDSSGNNINGLITKKSSVVGVNKAAFERDFPSLGAEEREVIPEVGRIPSPGLSSAIQSLPIGTSAAIGGEKWTSALAEVPVLVGSSTTPTPSVQQAVSSSSLPVALGTTNLNMAEAVAQGPSRAQTAPQVSVGAQRLEELAVKQSRQLIPVTPSMPKTSVSTPSDKQKTKVGHQSHPISSSLPVNHSPRGGPVKAADVSKSSNVGKLQVLKPVREKNGVTPVVMSPTSGNQVTSSTNAAAPSPSTRGPPNNLVLDRKPVVSVLEKRPTSQAKSRNDFFNSVRKKSMANSSSVTDSEANSSSGLDNGSAASPTYSDKGAEVEIVISYDTPHAGDNTTPLSGIYSEITCNGDATSIRKKHPSSDHIVSEEEEAAFLRSLGWEENADEGELTEEEISAFYRDFTKYINSKPLSLGILHGLQTNFLLPLGSQIGGIAAGISSGLSSSADTKLES